VLSLFLYETVNEFNKPLQFHRTIFLRVGFNLPAAGQCVRAMTVMLNKVYCKVDDGIIITVIIASVNKILQICHIVDCIIYEIYIEAK
jgi:hypothetical protein